MTGLKTLIEGYLDQLKDLESRVAEVKRKLEVAVEARQLLEEEGLTEQSASFRRR